MGITTYYKGQVLFHTCAVAFPFAQIEATPLYWKGTDLSSLT